LRNMYYMKRLIINIVYLLWAF